MSLDVKVWAVDQRKGKTKTTYRLRWSVTGHVFSDTFSTKELAERFRSDLRKAARSGDDFDEVTGLPESMERQRSQVSFYQHCVEFTAAAWPSAAAKSRMIIIDCLARAVSVTVRDIPGRPEQETLRRALTVALNPGKRVRVLDRDEAKAIAWVTKASRLLRDLEKPDVTSDILQALATRLDGKPAAPSFYVRRRQLLHRVLGAAVRQKRLTVNPLDRDQVSWTAPMEPDGVVDPRSVASADLIAGILDACPSIGRRAGRMRGFFAVMFYAMGRPSEVAMLTLADCDLPASGWGEVRFTLASPGAAKAYTDDGKAYELRGLKGRTRGRPRPSGRNPVRRVPVPPELVSILREHIQKYGTGEDGHLFRSEAGTVVAPTKWWRAWQQIRQATLTAEQYRSPLLQRPYDLRHSGVTWRLNSGAPAAEVAAWAGHTVAQQQKTYQLCTAGNESVWIARMDAALERDVRGHR